jgi:hypothetical protein
MSGRDCPPSRPPQPHSAVPASLGRILLSAGTESRRALGLLAAIRAADRRRRDEPQCSPGGRTCRDPDRERVPGVGGRNAGAGPPEVISKGPASGSSPYRYLRAALR